MVDAFSVVTASLTGDADKWTGWGHDLGKAADAVPTVGSGLEPLDFSLLPGAQDVASAYSQAATTFKDGLTHGAEQFSGIAAKLTSSADLYDSAEKQNLADIRAITER